MGDPSKKSKLNGQVKKEEYVAQYKHAEQRFPQQIPLKYI